MLQFLSKLFRKQPSPPVGLEERLRQSEEYFNRLAEGVRDQAIFFLDSRGQITSWNAGAQRLYGYRAEQIVGLHFSRLYSTDDVEADKPPKSLQGAVTFVQEPGKAWQIRNDGSRFWAETLLTTMNDATGELCGFSHLTRDLSASTRGEEHLLSVVNHVVDGIICIDEQGIVGTFNPAAEKIFGYVASEVIGQNVNILMPEPYHREHDSYIENYQRTGQAKIIGIGREVVGKRKDGSIFPMDLAISVFRLADRRYFTGIVRDITQRKLADQELRETEERMLSVVNHVVDGIITIDEKGLVQSFNPAAERLFGYKSDAVLDRNVNILMPNPYQREHDRYLSNYLGGGQAKIIGVGREVVGKRRDGSTFPMELAVSEFRLGDRRFFTGIVRDITERKQLEGELRQRVAELAEADRQKNEFLAMLAHELRNPLAPVRNALHVLKMPGAKATMASQARSMIERQVQHMVRLVDDLLDVSRIMRGKIELRLGLVELSGVFARAIETAQSVIDAQGHELTVSLPEEPIWLEADMIRLAQVIANLLTNAAKYTDQAGKICLSAQVEGPQVVLRVADSGIGISPELLPRVFDLFVQGDRSLARSQGGLGIGLTLVKRLVEMHSGTVEARSAGPGMGSEFAIHLPLLTKPPESEITDRSTDTLGVHSFQRRVLVVDDNIDAAESVAMLLVTWGHDVRLAHDGISALRLALEYRPEIVLLDIGLPGMSGYEVAQELRSWPQFHKTPMAAITGYGQDEDRRRSQEAGFDVHLTKPVDPNALEAFVASPDSFSVTAV